jgi:alpha-L-arabinofuranosidase
MGNFKGHLKMKHKSIFVLLAIVQISWVCFAKTDQLSLLISTVVGLTATDESAIPIITIDATAPQRTVSPEMYGIFFEEINHAGEGGLYAEMVQNRDMEACNIPIGWRTEGDEVVTPQGWRTPVWFKNDLPGWTYLAKGDVEGSMKLDDEQPLNDRNPHSLKLTITKMGKPEEGNLCGIANSGYWGMNIVKGDWYDVCFYARADQNRSVGLVFSLENDEGKGCARATIPEIGRGGWRQYKLSLHAYQSDSQCRLVISPIEPVTMWLDVVSVFPRKTFKNRPNGMRVDVAQVLADMKPGFLRFPGGCVVEGASLTNRFRWKDSIGDISQRHGDFNLWGYYSTYGLGYHEYLQFAEDLGAEAMYVCNVGMSCQARQGESCDDEDIDFYVQEVLDAIEYAVGPVTSEWGAKRAENGHPELFKLKYIEIGNENNGPDYVKRYEIFYKAIKEKYPDIITIADTIKDMGDLPIEIVDEHYYRSLDSFFGMADYYDDMDHSGPKIYVGEYAVIQGVGTGNLMGGISEAVYMLNMEKNADMVVMCSYAPLLENVNQRNWPVNLIWLDSSRVVGRSSYQIQKLFGNHRPDVVFQTTVETSKVSLQSVPIGRRRGPNTNQEQVEQSPPYVQADQLYAQAGLDKGAGELILKVVNPTPESVKGRIALKGLAGLGNTATLISVGNDDAHAENSLDNPNVVAPVTSKIAVSGSELIATFKPHSVTVLRLQARSE